MELSASWWMYLLNAFTPVLAIIMQAHLIAEQQKAASGNTEPVKAAEPLPPIVSAVAGLLTQVIMAAFIYTFWLAAHWLVFWFLNKPFNVDAYFYKPAHLAYWFPYLFGLYFACYSVVVAPNLSSTRFKIVMNSVNFLGFVASLYMVAVTYLKWLTM
ncbi:MAG: hypothetical protein KKE08_01625 [Gammaproteobacteria bacterium]|nr:hypothetical protein [Gammaproteobacteria bacterium]MBU2181708.1 hypothetical protein [Gammaproteobacteria bacterium]MBU2205304.1 hypothetical protein [Gammaproteobacteria bacterium]